MSKILPYVMMLNEGGGSTPTLKNLQVSPSTVSQEITAESEECDGFDKVNVEAVTSSIDNNIVASNIKKNVSILGVTGTLEEGSSLIEAFDSLPDVDDYENGTIIKLSSNGKLYRAVHQEEVNTWVGTTSFSNSSIAGTVTITDNDLFVNNVKPKPNITQLPMISRLKVMTNNQAYCTTDPDYYGQDYDNYMAINPTEPTGYSTVSINTDIPLCVMIEGSPVNVATVNFSKLNRGMSSVAANFAINKTSVPEKHEWEVVDLQQMSSTEKEEGIALKDVITSSLVSSNIKQGQTIFGVNGNYVGEYDTQTVNITTNGTTSVSSYTNKGLSTSSSIKVNVSPNLLSGSGTITNNGTYNLNQLFNNYSGYDGAAWYSSLNVNVSSGGSGDNEGKPIVKVEMFGSVYPNIYITPEVYNNYSSYDWTLKLSFYEAGQGSFIFDRNMRNGLAPRSQVQQMTFESISLGKSNFEFDSDTGNYACKAEIYGPCAIYGLFSGDAMSQGFNAGFPFYDGNNQGIMAGECEAEFDINALDDWSITIKNKQF